MSTDITAATVPVTRGTEFSIRVNLGRALSVIVPILIWFAPLDIEATTRHGLAIAAFMIVAWITEALDHSVAGLIGCYLFWALSLDFRGGGKNLRLPVQRAAPGLLLWIFSGERPVSLRTLVNGGRIFTSAVAGAVVLAAARNLMEHS